MRERAYEAMGFVAKLTASTQKRADPLMPIVGIVMACATALFAALIGSKSLLFLTSEVLLCLALVHILASRFAIAASVVVWPLAFTIFAIATFMLTVSLSNLTTGLAHALASVPGPFFISLFAPFFISFVCSSILCLRIVPGLGTIFIPALVGPLGDDGTSGIVWESAIVQHALCFARAALLAL